MQRVRCARIVGREILCRLCGSQVDPDSADVSDESEQAIGQTKPPMSRHESKPRTHEPVDGRPGYISGYVANGTSWGLTDSGTR